jgi:hypothetical protein
MVFGKSAPKGIMSSSKKTVHPMRCSWAAIHFLQRLWGGVDATKKS